MSQKQKKQEQEAKCSGPCNCSGGMVRRDFLKMAGAGSMAVLAAQLPAMAGPFEGADFEKLVPSDKKLSPEWVKSLFERGAPQIYKGEELKYIGMPIGGIGSGQLYLGGDGKLWHWDIFNKHVGTGDGHYAHPPQPQSPLEQGFAIQVSANGKTEIRSLDKTGFPDVSFRGEYPIGRVEYGAVSGLPISVSLEAFSPFIPLSADESSLPATVMRFTVKNTSADKVEATLYGWLENAVCLDHRGAGGERRNRILHGKGYSFLDCSVGKPAAAAESNKPDVLFEDWSKGTYEGWAVEGTAFGKGPIRKSGVPEYQGDVGGDTEWVVNSHATAPGAEVGAKDGATGKLTSRKFVIERAFIHVWIGGGAHKDTTCFQVLVDGKVVKSVTGRNDNGMSLQGVDVRDLKGKEAVIRLLDAEAGGWGNLGIGRITFSDRPVAGGEALENLSDYGTMGLALLGEKAEFAATAGGEKGLAAAGGETASSSLADKLVGGLGRKLAIAGGASVSATFVVAWNFPNDRIGGLRDVGPRRYAKRFANAEAVAAHVAKEFDSLAGQTRLWRDTWYDSTLPYWFLDRTFLNTSILATSTSHWFANDRFWGWEGVGCCHGTCGHVWQYAHAMARLFPFIERVLREKVDFGLALKPDGAIWFRAEHNNIPAIDSQAGTVLRALREHQMSADDAFLRRVWPGVKKAVEWLISKDADGDGLIESNQHNTLDTDWFGPSSWLSGLYVAALRAGEEMAIEVGDKEFAGQCRAIFERGRKNLVEKLFDGEYFFSRPDPKHPEAVNSGSGCEIDQAMGQGWAWQVGLGRVFPEKETLTALKSLWKYNFSPDVGPYRKANTPGRWYAMAGEAGLLMCTFPRADWNYDKAKGRGKGAWAAMYFNECMNGFEYQAAGHMVWEGLLLEGLAVTRAVHDRYHAARRNPWNEVECGDHYARSMASYGVFLAACGFEYHGPRGHIGFAPRLTPENFKAPFTAAEGWGTFEQTAKTGGLTARIAVKYGKLRLKTIALAAGKDAPGSAQVTVKGKAVDSRLEVKDGKATITLTREAILNAGESLEVAVG